MRSIEFQWDRLRRKLEKYETDNVEKPYSNKGRVKHIYEQLNRLRILKTNGPNKYVRRPVPRFTVVEEEFRDIYAELNRRRIENTRTRSERRAERSASNQRAAA